MIKKLCSCKYRNFSIRHCKDSNILQLSQFRSRKCDNCDTVLWCVTVFHYFHSLVVRTEARSVEDRMECQNFIQNWYENGNNPLKKIATFVIGVAIIVVDQGLWQLWFFATIVITSSWAYLRQSYTLKCFLDISSIFCYQKQSQSLSKNCICCNLY